MTNHELDVRPLPQPGKHPAIFQAYDALGVGESIAVVNDHHPRHLRDEFEVEHPGGYAWEYLARERGAAVPHRPPAPAGAHPDHGSGLTWPSPADWQPGR